MSATERRGRPLLDAGAAFWAALLCAVALPLLCAFPLAMASDTNAWVVLRLFAAPLLGTDILAPPATFDAGALAVGGALLAVAGFALAYLLALAIHRFGLLFGIVAGAAYGVALYALVVYAASAAFAPLATLQGLPFAATCALFGALAGGVYEWLEVETFELEGQH